MAENQKRKAGRDAWIGAISGTLGGVANAGLTHPYDTVMTRAQEPGGVLRTRDLLTAPWARFTLDEAHSIGKPELAGKLKNWSGVSASVFKKGLGFGIGMGTAFAVGSGLKNFMDKKSSLNLTHMGFKKYDNN